MVVSCDDSCNENYEPVYYLYFQKDTLNGIRHYYDSCHILGGKSTILPDVGFVSSNKYAQTFRFILDYNQSALRMVFYKEKQTDTLQIGYINHLSYSSNCGYQSKMEITQLSSRTLDIDFKRDIPSHGNYIYVNVK